MSLRLIYGRAGTGKSSFCLQQIKERLKEDGDKPLILFVPEQYSLQGEKNLVDAVESGGIMRADILTFRRMASRVFNEVGGIAKNHINQAGKSMILFRLVEGMAGRMQISSMAIKQPGFIDTMSELISEFKHFNVSPDMLLKASEDLSQSEALKGKLRDIGNIYGIFDDFLNRVYSNPDDDLARLYQRLDYSHQFDGAEIWIDEFSGFTPQEYMVLGKLMEKAERVNITLCTDKLPDSSMHDVTNVFAPVYYTASKLISLAEEKGVKQEKPVNLAHDKDRPGRFKDSPELMHLERYLNEYPFRPYMKRTGCLTIFSASNIYSEVEETAMDIIRAVRDEGLRYRDIAVVTGNLEGYRKLIGAVFSQYGIPYFLDVKRDIDNNPLSILISSALDIFNRSWSYETVFRYLKTGLLDFEKDEIDALENYVLEWGIKGSRWTSKEDWNFKSTEGSNTDENSEQNAVEHLSYINSLRKKAALPLLRFRSKTRGRRNAKDICTALYEMLLEVGVPGKIEEMIGEFERSGELSLANEYRQVWNIVMEVFDQVVEIMGDETLTAGDFSKILAIGFGQYKTGVIPPALDQVLVGNIERSKSHDVKALYIIGVNDRIFPREAFKEGVLSDRDREILGGAGIELSKDSRSKAFEEQFLVYTALTSSGRYLRLSYPIADFEGKTMHPSIIISRIKKIFPNVRLESNIIPKDGDKEILKKACAADPFLNELAAALRRSREGEEINPLWWEAYKWYRTGEGWNERLNTALLGLAYSNRADSIRREKVQKLYGSRMYSSVSRLEKYAACPFSYYIQFGLKAKERKIFKLNAPDTGTFMHEVISGFSLRLEKEGKTWRNMDRKWCESTVEEVVGELLSRMGNSVLTSSSRYRYIAGRLKRVLIRAIWIIGEHIKNSGFEPAGYEIGFGENGEYPPITINLPTGEEVRLTGRIDRLDTMETEEGTYLRIIDYKSGSKAFKLADVFYGLQIQLITYMDAVWEDAGNKSEKPCLPGGILYFKIDDPIIKSGKMQSEEEIEKAIMKQLKMKGLVLADVKLIKEMDRNIEGDSLIIPARLNKGDVLGRSSAATAKQFEMLRKHVRRLLEDMSCEILEGNVSIKPYKKKGATSCQFCNYRSICQFDLKIPGNRYSVLKDCSDEEVWRLLGNEEDLGKE